MPVATPLTGFSNPECGLSYRVLLGEALVSFQSLLHRYKRIHGGMDSMLFQELCQSVDRDLVSLQEVDADFERELSSLRTLSQSLARKRSTPSSLGEDPTVSSLPSKRMKTEESISMR